MGLSNSDVMPLIASASSYEVEQSLRFNDDDSAYLNRTFSSGNRRTWTYSLWFKPSNINPNVDVRLLSTTTGGNDFAVTYRASLSNGEFQIQHYTGSVAYTKKTIAKIRDNAAWYHVVFRIDTTHATGSSRFRIYINGVEAEYATVDESTYNKTPTQNLETYVNAANAHYISKYHANSSSYIDGYLSEVNFIDGQSLGPEYFGETDQTYGHWKPIAYTGTYGTNGFYLDFSGTFYNDQSGNSNNWTANNLSSYDVVLDTPTNNFATLNVNANPQGATLSEGNLRAAGVTTDKKVFATQSIKGGKWYWEIYLKTQGNRNMLGVISDDVTWNNTNISDGTVEKAYVQQGNVRQRDETQEYTNSVTGTWATGDIITIAFDADNGKIWIHKNQVPATGTTPSTSAGTGTTGMTTSLTYLPFYMEGGGTVSNDIFNFGQDSSFAGNKTAQGNADDNNIGDFYYSPPSGFLALCTANLSDPAVVPKEVFNTVLWDGNSSNPRSITGVGFQPDVVWGKIRSAVGNHYVMDSSRGSGTGTLKVLNADTNDSEQTNNSGGSTSFGVYTSIDSDGFTVNSGSSSAKNTNETSQKYVAWNWKVNGGTTSSNTSGSITSTVQANQDAGFSIITYTGNGTQGATIGHGLTQAPEFFQTKVRNTSNNWHGWHTGLTDAGYSIEFDLPNTQASNSNHWANTEPSSSVITLGTNGGINASGNSYVCYAWHSVPGYSKVGSFIGNANSDGPFIWTGFKPDLVIFKAIDLYEDWVMIDSTRDSYNPAGRNWVYVDGSSGGSLDGSNTKAIDYYSNGFKPRVTTSFFNNSNQKCIYIAFAQTPFKYANAR